jgi:Asp-tRNA(Asn)/Glu-tRNA(Gln) amidotransferase A subunit family amidase
LKREMETQRRGGARFRKAAAVRPTRHSRGEKRLLGVPMTVKESFSGAGLATTGASGSGVFNETMRLQSSA